MSEPGPFTRGYERGYAYGHLHGSEAINRVMATLESVARHQNSLRAMLERADTAFYVPPAGGARFNFTDNLDDRLAAMEKAQNGDDVPFLVAAVRHWRAVATGQTGK